MWAGQKGRLRELEEDTGGVQVNSRLGSLHTWFFMFASCSVLSLSSLLSLLPSSILGCHFKLEHKVQIDVAFRLQTHRLHSSAFHPCPNLVLLGGHSRAFSLSTKDVNEFHPFYLDVNTLPLQCLVTSFRGCKRPETGISQEEHGGGGGRGRGERRERRNGRLWRRMGCRGGG